MKIVNRQAGFVAVIFWLPTSKLCNTRKVLQQLKWFFCQGCLLLKVCRHSRKLFIWWWNHPSFYYGSCWSTWGFDSFGKLWERETQICGRPYTKRMISKRYFCGRNSRPNPKDRKVFFLQSEFIGYIGCTDAQMRRAVGCRTQLFVLQLALIYLNDYRNSNSLSRRTQLPLLWGSCSSF